MEETMLKDYEVIFILAPQLEGADLDKTKQEISEPVAKCGGTITFKESEKRTIAYPINKQNLGIYLITQISISPENISYLSEQLKLNKQILRHIINQLEVPKAGIEKTKAIKKRPKPEKEGYITEKKPLSPPAKVGSTEDKLEEIDKKLDELIDKI